MIYIVLLSSFLLDDILLCTVSPHTVLQPLCTLLSLVIIYPYFRQSKKFYYSIAFLLGALYDISYTNTLFLHALLFLGVSYLVHTIFHYIAIDFMNTYVVGMTIIWLYRTVLAVFFVLLGMSMWQWSIYFQSIVSSILWNSLYLAVFYFWVTKLRQYKKMHKYRVDKIEKVEK